MLSQDEMLSRIATLSTGELRGWAWAINWERRPFEGERAALEYRAKQLGTSMREICSRKGS